MPVNTGYLGSGHTTWFTSGVSITGPVELTSTLSVRGATTLHGALNSSSAVSGGAGAFSTISSAGSALINEIWGSTISGSHYTSNRTVQVTDVWASVISQGGFAMPIMSSFSTLVAASVVQGSASSFTVITWAAVAPGDIIVNTLGAGHTTVSSLSSGLVAHSHCTQSGQFEFRYSNVSTLVQNQSAKSWYFTRIRPF